MNNTQTKSPPPSFAEAKNPRQKARASGMDPNRWYVVEYDSAVKKEQVKEVTFWNTSIALYRGDDGNLPPCRTVACTASSSLPMARWISAVCVAPTMAGPSTGTADWRTTPMTALANR